MSASEADQERARKRVTIVPAYSCMLRAMPAAINFCKVDVGGPVAKVARGARAAIERLNPSAPKSILAGGREATGLPHANHVSNASTGGHEQKRLRSP